MKVKDKLHAPADIPPEILLLVSAGYEILWALIRRKHNGEKIKYSDLVGNRTQITRSSNPQPRIVRPNEIVQTKFRLAGSKRPV
jgi:hypothetical protein